MELAQIQAELATETSPVVIAELRVKLSHKFGVATDELTKIELEKPALWQKYKEVSKTNKEADMMWEASDLGRKEKEWKANIKKIEKMLSACKTLVDARNTEYFNSNV